MKKTQAERDQRKAERWKLRLVLAPLLVETGRLGSWDDHDREKIDAACDVLLQDWAKAVEKRLDCADGASADPLLIALPVDGGDEIEAASSHPPKIGSLSKI
jgi:hypothetical protein